MLRVPFESLIWYYYKLNLEIGIGMGYRRYYKTNTSFSNLQSNTTASNMV